MKSKKEINKAERRKEWIAQLKRNNSKVVAEKERLDQTITVPLGKHYGKLLTEVPFPDLRELRVSPLVGDSFKAEITKILNGEKEKTRGKKKVNPFVLQSGPFKGYAFKDVPYRYLKNVVGKNQFFPKFVQKEIQKVLKNRKNEEVTEKF